MSNLFHKIISDFSDLFFFFLLFCFARIVVIKPSCIYGSRYSNTLSPYAICMANFFVRLTFLFLLFRLFF